MQSELPVCLACNNSGSTVELKRSPSCFSEGCTLLYQHCHFGHTCSQQHRSCIRRLSKCWTATNSFASLEECEFTALTYINLWLSLTLELSIGCHDYILPLHSPHMMALCQACPSCKCHYFCEWTAQRTAKWVEMLDPIVNQQPKIT